MEFTLEMLDKLNPEERIFLTALYTKAQETRPSAVAPEWEWTMKGPATEETALRARKGGPSPRLTAGRATAAQLVQAALTLTGGRALPVSSPEQRLSTQKE